MKDILLTNIKDETGVSIELGIAGEKIISKNELAQNYSKIDGKGLTVIPGLIDLHTHLREPGREDAETVLTASHAAVAGGFTDRKSTRLNSSHSSVSRMPSSA